MPDDNPTSPAFRQPSLFPEMDTTQGESGPAIRSDPAMLRYHERKSAGLCPMCGGSPDKPGQILCSACQLRSNERNRAMTSRRRANPRLCVYCGKSTRHGKNTRCLKCLERQRKNWRARRARLAEQGLCLDCQRPKGRTPWKSCDPCREAKNQKGRARIESRVADGLCIRCGSPAEVTERCYRPRRAEPNRVQPLCLRCWMKGFSRLRGYDQEALKRLWDKQGGRCAYTGEELTLGVNASVDHIIPVSAGGDSTEDNLHWVLIKINHMKSDLSESEFVELCGKVWAHRGEG